MARLRFKKPKIAILMSEIISLTIWLFLGDRVIDALDTIIGVSYDLNISNGASYPAVTEVEGCDNASVFEDAYEIMGLGFSCEDFTNGVDSSTFSNQDNGLLGVIGLVMVVMVLMNFITYS